MRALTLILLALCSAPAVAEVTQISDDTFVIRRSDKAGIFGNTARMRDRVMAEAADFAAEKGKLVETVSLSETGNGFMRFATIEYTFRLVDEAQSEPAAGSSIDLYTELRKLDELRDEGLLTDEEFEAEKQKLLDAN